MIYLREIVINTEIQHWPMTIPAFAGLERLAFDAPITLLCGENGSGKSTLLEAIAAKLSMPAVGRVDAGRDPTLDAIRPFARGLRTSFLKKPVASLFLRSEDFFNFILSLQRTREEMNAELARVDREYEHHSAFTRAQAKMAYASVIGDMESRYGDDLLDHASHGESYLRLFQNRLHPRGLYLLDEPEAPLSILRQLSLLSLMRELTEQGDCQFIIATHSPVLLAYPGARIYSFDESPIEEVAYEQLESVRLLKTFLDAPERFLRRL